jgi:hypothetical protein
VTFVMVVGEPSGPRLKWKVVMRKDGRELVERGFDGYAHAALFSHFVGVAWDSVEILEDDDEARHNR